MIFRISRHTSGGVRNGSFRWLWKRYYHPVTGVFGNYQPFRRRLKEEEDRMRRKSRISDSDPEDRMVSGELPPPYRLIKDAFRNRGHLLGHFDPLTKPISNGNEWDDEEFRHRLTAILGVDIERFMAQDGQDPGPDRRDFLRQLWKTYCGVIGYEYGHLMSLEEIDWFDTAIGQSMIIDDDSDDGERKMLAKELLITEAFDHFLAKKFQSVKRYGCEGAETMVIFVQQLIGQLCHDDEMQTMVDDMVIGMPHRGRLNLLLNTMMYPMEALFAKLQGGPEFDIGGDHGRHIAGDVLSHLYAVMEFARPSENPLQVTLLPNPSHLEVVSPVVCGFARGLLLRDRRGPYNHREDPQNDYPVLPVQIHGDASFTGQGIIMETLAMSNVEHYTVGGSVHLVVNNQIGYTTPGRMHQARSSLYCTDPVKMIAAPVIHVNGDYPEAVALAARLALQYWNRFHKDVAVDLVCFRRWGHNELDDPTFTNPAMYRLIGERKSIPETYAQHVGMEPGQVGQIRAEYQAQLNEALQRVENYRPPPLPTLINGPQSVWRHIQWPSRSSIHKWNTAVPETVLRHIGKVSVSAPESWTMHPTLKKVFRERQTKIESGTGLDWATAESLAFGSLLLQGYDVRLSGQDVGRGTFSQRHAMIVDQNTDDTYIPLNGLGQERPPEVSELSAKCGQLEICNSILSEEGVMAFEYGLSVTGPEVLVLWEAQFGDFFNGAQPIIDTLVAGGECKWLLQTSLTLLLPHGYDGAGPEHTSGRLERFLQQSNSSETEIDSDQVNWSVVYPTTPGQYFHLLRRQMIRPYRKPMVVMAPKMLLRHPRCVSTIDQLCGEHFRPVVDDPRFDQAVETVNPVSSVIFCSGKHYYALEKEMAERNISNSGSIAIVRLEELCPFPAYDLALILKRYPNAKKFIWSQEEHRNQGAWTFVEPRFRNLFGRQLHYVGRTELEIPAVGIVPLHQQQSSKLLRDTFEMACQT